LWVISFNLPNITCIAQSILDHISVLSLEHFIDAIPDGDIRLRLREANPKNINEAETLAVRLETLKLADSQKGRMIRKVGEQAPDLNPVKINNSEDNIKHLKDNFQELKKEMSSSWLWPPSPTSIGFPGSLYFGHNSY
jgi:hypothetical protein